jgi:hypothetical protein
MKFERGNNFGEIVGFVSELRPENIIMEPVERIPVDSEIFILVLALAISRFVEWKKYEAKKVIQENVVKKSSNLEIDQQQLEEVNGLSNLESVIVKTVIADNFNLPHLEEIVASQNNVVGPGSNLEDDREQLEVAFLLNQTTETVKHMRASIEREQRVGKFYR